VSISSASCISFDVMQSWASVLPLQRQEACSGLEVLDPEFLVGQRWNNAGAILYILLLQLSSICYLSNNLKAHHN
jgi:hypothetical protein